ncbi:hypothetical protein VKT23_015455 [Stygiomarasmius scandens]|uniref:LigT-like protein n=1 Tax=Marasmiellus scandens TaxID=2682957 RepID=A0ABR1J0Y4_9AGAR
MGYSLWLVPSEQQRKELESFMKNRSSLYEKKPDSRSYPNFKPHITLVAAPSLPSLDSILSPEITKTPVLFKPGSLRAGGGYLGAITLNISKTPELMQLHNAIVTRLRTVHKIEPNNRGFPHISLFYVQEDDERQRLVKELELSRKVMTKDNKLMLTCDPGSVTAKQMDGYMGAEIWLVDCTSREVERWNVKEKRKI